VWRNGNLSPEQTVDDVSREVWPPVLATMFDSAQDFLARDLEHRGLDFRCALLQDLLTGW
jgi:hypothetical protein